MLSDDLETKTVDVSIPSTAIEKRVHKIIIDARMLQLGFLAGCSILGNLFLIFFLVMLIPQTHKNRIYQTYEMGYAMGVNCENDPVKCARDSCFELLDNEITQASCTRGINDGWRNKSEFEDWRGVQ